MRRVLPLLACVGLSCASAKPKLVDARAVSSASGSPSIEAIIDLGTAGLPADERLALDRGNGYGVIGELLLVSGSSFGKQPTVTVDTLPTEVLGHVDRGGVVIRVPWGIDPGDVAIEVSNASGRDSRRFPLKRLAVVVDEQHMHVLGVARDAAVTSLHRIDLPEAQQLALTTEGAWALVSRAGAPAVARVDLTASPPRVGSFERLSGKRIVGIASATHAPRSVIVTDTHVVNVDTRRPGRPAFYQALSLPLSVVDGEPRDVALSPDGRWLAVLLGVDNRVALFSVEKATELPEPKLAPVLTDTRLELVRSLAFDAEGKALQILSGDGPSSIEAGKQPAKMTTLRVSEAGEISAGGQVTLPEGAPHSMAVARGNPTPPGTSIRATPPARAAFYATSYPSDLIAQKPPQYGGRRGSVGRVEVGKAPEVTLSGGWLLGSIDVAGKTEVLIATGCQVNGSALSRMVIARPAWSDEPPKVIVLGPLNNPQTPPSFGEIRLQP